METEVVNSGAIGDLMSFGDWLLDKVTSYGLGTVLIILVLIFLIAIVWKNFKSVTIGFWDMLKSVGSWLQDCSEISAIKRENTSLRDEVVTSRQEREDLRKEFMDELKKERERCDLEMKEIQEQNKKEMDDLRAAFLELSVSTSAEIATLKTSLERNMHKSKGNERDN